MNGPRGRAKTTSKSSKDLSRKACTKPCSTKSHLKKTKNESTALTVQILVLSA